MLKISFLALAGGLAIGLAAPSAQAAPFSPAVPGLDNYTSVEPAHWRARRGHRSRYGWRGHRAPYYADTIDRDGRADARSLYPGKRGGAPYAVPRDTWR